jgi:hypothetical protein
VDVADLVHTLTAVAAPVAAIQPCKRGDFDMSHPTPTKRRFFERTLAGAMLASLALASSFPAVAGEGGVAHVMPGANTTMVDLPPTSPGWFFKPMYINYQGDATAKIPTAAGIVANLSAETNTLALGGGYGFEQKVLGAHFGVAAFLPYTWVNISGSTGALGGKHIQNDVSGLGDLTIVPVLMAWKDGDVQWDFLFPIYAPTGSYELGRLGNTGLNYWTFDPIVGVSYNNAKSGLNAAIHVGYAMNTENNDTHYKSGSYLHLDASLQQIFPLGSGFANVGVEGWYFQQATCDSGSGATLGCFKGRTAGIGPVIGYIQPIGQQKLLFELKWLPELETKNRLNGDFIWFKMVYKF